MTDRVGTDTVFVPMHFAENAVNELTDAERLDPEAKTPEFKMSAVRIRPVEGESDTVRSGDTESISGDD